jgi:acyl-coenzyme A thioesterase PaaI-like protein
VMKTNPDGSLTAVTLASLGITQMNLTEDTTHIEMPDGSAITGQGTFVMGGVAHTLANTTLMAEADGSQVEGTDFGSCTHVYRYQLFRTSRAQ